MSTETKRSVIPAAAHEQIDQTWQDGTPCSAYYLLEGRRVGYRSWSETGELLMEYAIRDDRMHGIFRTWHENGARCEEGWYENGKAHGTYRQYDTDGTLIGGYTMIHGSGVDLWFSAPGVISEERHYRDGERHGFERWWNADNRTISEEGHYHHGIAHGIFRQWNAAGRIRRGYPKYAIAGQAVSKARYVRVAARDPSLPAFRIEENAPYRSLPNLEVVLDRDAPLPEE